MTLKAGVLAALVSVAVTALLIVAVRGRAEDFKQNQTGRAALGIVHLIKRDRLPPTLNPAGAQALQVLNAGGRVVASTPNLRGRGRMARFQPDEDNVFAVRTLCPPSGLRGCMRVISFRVYQQDGDWTVYASDRGVPWYVSGGLLGFLVAASVLMSLMAAVRTWRTVDHTLAPVDAIRAELAEITDTESGRRVPVPASRDEIRLLAETANATLDRLDAALARQRQFTSDASHDLRSPITAARAQLEEALLNPAEADWPRVGRSVLASLERLQAIVTDLLELARLDAVAQGDGAGRRGERLDLGALVDAELDRASRYRQKRLVRSLEQGVEVQGDRLRLSRLLANLLDNAERHAVEQITVTVRGDDGAAVLEVTDDGEGIAPEDREAVFQRFARLKAGRERDAQGTGLGLPIARQVARAHHGTLTVEDSPRGARFVLRLPRRQRRPGT
ncbi:sensor histidine kinase [Actinomadura rugatobispora]|uniref:histidine kinase n=1 Tax=Actinomadura rugatobispora TaxID=1994 RepID=A0ABW0ZYS9_9ACTN